ncbi:sensor histidine kinase [Paenibacillus sp. PL91]|uniref:sensor histidine kinase n=1 Tax=Paenibacillus sp. PL91 TaxID=2729538 RepID=UPI00145E82A7|nr:sensor histidine kinase [Paenibacillus sp. PL91]MBC9200783.1 sensor histidine kinase [Paenibacillus sp. PL91]
MKIRTKIFFTTALVVIFLLGSLTYFMTRFSSHILMTKMEQDVGFSTSQLSQNIDSLLQSYEQVIDSLYTNSELQSRLLTRYDSIIEAQDVYFDYYLPFVNWVRGSKNILRLMVYTNNPTFQFADVKWIDEEIKQSEWFKTTQQPDKKLVKTWTNLGIDPYYRFRVIRLTQRMNNPVIHSQVYVTIDLQEQLLQNLISKENQKQRFIIGLPNGQVVMDSFLNNKAPIRIQDYDFYKQIEQANEGKVVYVKENNERYLLTVKSLDTRSSVRGLKAIVLTPTGELTSKVNEMKRIAIILLVSSIIIAVIMMYTISSKLTKRLMLLAAKMRTDNITQSYSQIALTGNDEISQLGLIYNQMILRNSLLIKEVYEFEFNKKELELKAKESELYALQTQINPHYLFNTLNAIRGNLLKKGDKENANIIKLLAQSFRNLLGKSGSVVRLEEEIGIVDTYLRIQSYRFGGRLQYHIHIPKEHSAYQLPRLSLQTLVENAIIHALEKNEDDTLIYIESQVIDNQHYHIVVRDNGSGISPLALEKIRQQLNDSSMEHERNIGLRNVHQRLTQMYGPEYGLTIHSEEGRGTCVTLMIPLKT